MPFGDLLPDRCTIQNRTVDTSGKTHVESWAAQAAPTPCRALIRIANSYDAEKARQATSVRARFALPKTAVVAKRDRILHDGEVYEVIKVVKPFDAAAQHHTVAICEATV